jgi:decaprenylphospho-beta-D-erythro-pentofuranosid-2-ulose 2-reductase
MRDGVDRVESVLLLGGTSEIGLAIVRRLVDERGVRRVVLAGRDPARLQAAAATLGPTTTVHTVDFDARAMETHPAFVESVWAEHGDVDITVLAFGALGGDDAQADPDAVRELAETNYVGAVTTATAVAAQLERQGHGALVVLSSMAAVRPRRANYAYASTKAGLDAFATGLGIRLAPYGAHVLVVRPGYVRTRMTAGLPEAPFATDAAVVADEVLRGLDRGRRCVYAPRALRWASVLIRLAPARLWERVRR